MNRLLLLIFALVFLLACGGGTRGTGLGDEGPSTITIENDEPLIEGQVVDQDGRPIPGVIITNLSTDTESRADENGSFVVSLTPDEKVVALLLDIGTDSASLEFPSMMDPVAQLVLKIEVNLPERIVRFEGSVHGEDRFEGKAPLVSEDR